MFFLNHSIGSQDTRSQEVINCSQQGLPLSSGTTHYLRAMEGACPVAKHTL